MRLYLLSDGGERVWFTKATEARREYRAAVRRYSGDGPIEIRLDAYDVERGLTAKDLAVRLLNEGAWAERVVELHYFDR